MGWLESNTWSSARSLRSQIPSLAQLESATYSASVDESATQGCFWLRHVIGVDPSKKRYPDVDFRSSLSLAQSEPEYPSKRESSPRR